MERKLIYSTLGFGCGYAFGILGLSLIFEIITGKILYLGYYSFLVSILFLGIPGSWLGLRLAERKNKKDVEGGIAQKGNMFSLNVPQHDENRTIKFIYGIFIFFFVLRIFYFYIQPEAITRNRLFFSWIILFILFFIDRVNRTKFTKFNRRLSITTYVFFLMNALFETFIYVFALIGIS